MSGLKEPLEGHALLQQPFPKEQIQQLPQGGIKLDYVSHGNVTKRLLEVDPTWNWEPVALDEQGLPAFDQHGGLWIKLTILGITRYGYGEPQGRDKYDQQKGAIGNAIRNAAMRFGVALDLWAKEAIVQGEPVHLNSTPGTDMPRIGGTPARANKITDKQVKLITSMTNGDMGVVSDWKESKGIDRTLTTSEASELIDWLKENGYKAIYKGADPWADIPKGGSDE